MRRSTDPETGLEGADGADLTTAIIDILDVGGSIRGQLVALIAAERSRQAEQDQGGKKRRN
jgi:hypothetical protein